MSTRASRCRTIRGSRRSDAARREEIMAVIERIRDELRLPILYVSHDRTEVERLADMVIPMAG